MVQMAPPARFQALLVCSLLLMQLAQHAAAAHASQQQQHQQQRRLAAVGGFGGVRTGGFSISRPTTTRPITGAAPITYRPATTPPRSATTAAPQGARATGSTPLPGGFTGYARTGFRSTPFILPLALGSGLLAASAVSTLNANRNAYCNGVTVQCYKAACQDALSTRCPEAAAASNNTLVLGACPNSRYSECYRTPTFNNTGQASFECFGVRRPRYGSEDLAAVCHQPGGSSSSGAGAAAVVGGKGLHMLLPLAAAALLLLCL